MRLHHSNSASALCLSRIVPLTHSMIVSRVLVEQAVDRDGIASSRSLAWRRAASSCAAATTAEAAAAASAHLCVGGG